jgi:hypothetical protein
MNRILTPKYFTAFGTKICAVIVILSFFSAQIKAQNCSESYSFRSPELIEGVAGQVGAIYKFKDVGVGIDAHISIVEIQNAVLGDIDIEYTGYLQAWQPTVQTTDVNGGFIEWKITFKKEDTNTDTILCTPFTAIDIDGNSTYQEFVQTRDFTSYGTDPDTWLVISDPQNGFSIQARGDGNEQSGISTTEKKVMIQFNFIEISSFSYRMGTTGNTNGGARQFALFFQPFLRSTCEDITDAGIIGVNQAFCSNSPDFEISNLEKATGGAGKTIYEWYKTTGDTTSANWETMPNSDQLELSATTSLSQTTYFLRKARNKGCLTFDKSSNIVEIRIDTPVVAASAGADQSRCSKTFEGRAQTPAIGMGTWSVVTGVAAVAEPNNPNSIITLTSIQATLRWTTTNGACSASDDVLFRTVQPLVITLQPIAAKQVCKGAIDTLFVSVYGGAGQYGFQWQVSSDELNWDNIAGANQNFYVFPTNTPGVFYYRVQIKALNTEGCAEEISRVVRVEVAQMPQVSAVNVNPTAICIGGNVVLQAQITGGVGCTIQWQTRPNAASRWSDMAGETQNTLAVSNLSQSVRYRARLSCGGLGCCTPL